MLNYIIQVNKRTQIGPKSALFQVLVESERQPRGQRDVRPTQTFSKNIMIYVLSTLIYLLPVQFL
jgi:hypothetical protein